MICDLGRSQTPRRDLGDMVARCILEQIHRPYPCYESQVLSRPEDLSLPSERYPVFHGSFDWHSCVHSHWALVRLLRRDALAGETRVRVIEALERSFCPTSLEAEAHNWSREPSHVELPYGLTWLLTLDAELSPHACREEDPKAGQATPDAPAGHAHESSDDLAALLDSWRRSLQPMVDMALPRVCAWVESLRLPVRSGVHSDSAWSLAMAWDWAKAQPNDETSLADLVADRSQRLFGEDRDAPVSYEPSGETFTSPILNEAALMARVLPRDSLMPWLGGFLPQLANGNPGELLGGLPTRWDGVSYFGVHEVALPLARCLSLRDVTQAIAQAAGPDLAEPGARLARRWLAQGLRDLDLKGYLADHWVGSFVVAACDGTLDVAF